MEKSTAIYLYIKLKKHPYITATLLATLLATVVWLYVPKEYTAITKLSDEYKEVDLAIGLNRIQAQIKEAMGGANTGMNDMGIYCKVLQTEDFARAISKKQVPGRDMTYGEYLGDKDTIEVIQGKINYNYSNRQETLTISFTDREALIAAQMLDSITTELQNVITHYRHSIVNAAIENAKKELRDAEKKYKKTQNAYISFSDTHLKASTQEIRQQENTLKKELSNAQKYYQMVSTQYVRQLALKQRSYCSFAVINNNSVPHQTDSFFVSYLLSFIFIAIILTKGYISYLNKNGHLSLDMGDFFSPWNLTIFIWTADILLYYIQGTLDPIGPKFFKCFILWLITFLPASLITYWLTKGTLSSVPDFKKPINVNIWIFHLFFAFSIIMTIAYAKTIWNVVNQFDTENLLFNIRLLAIYETLTSGILNYTQSINYALFFIAIWLYPRISKYQLAAIVILYLIIEFAMMEKSGILVMIVGTLFVLYERKVIRITTIGITLLSTILLFFFFNMAKEDADSDTSMTFLDFFGMYVTSPMVAFEHLQITISENWGANTFNAVFPYINRLGFHFQTIERLQDFVYVPIITNVYTIMQPFYNDFGTSGVAFFGFAYGTIFGYIYRKFREGKVLCRCLYTFLTEVIIIQFYNENFLQSFFLVAGFIIFTILMTQDIFRLSIKSK